MSKQGSYSAIALALGSFLIVGCATKGYVRKTVEPVDQKVQQVDKDSQKRDADESSRLNKTNQTVEEDQKKLDATSEVARTADTQANAAMAKATQNTTDLGNLRKNLQDVVANIDDYKPDGDAAVVHFGVNKSTLTKDDKAKLDEVATKAKGMQRYFLTVAGYTDQSGSKAYNEQLSRERANQVISYLVGSQDVPVYRIHMIGLGDMKLIDNGKGRKGRMESRRVEVTIFGAKPLTAGM